jgi:5-methylcytosine-specific restriction endonuclease McrA
MLSKQCEQCGTAFRRPSNRAAKQWERMRFCSTACANRWRALHAVRAGAAFKGGEAHGQAVRAGWLRSSRGKRKASRLRRKEQAKAARESRRNSRLQLALWGRLCACGAPIATSRQFCDECNVARKRAQRKRWNALNPNYERLYQRARKVLEGNAVGICSPAQAHARFAFYGGCCAYCGTALGQSWHWDHVIPLSRGGTNWPSNLRPACPDCNQRKGAQDWRTWGVREAPNPI